MNPKKIKPIALFDMDGTLADYLSAMKRDLESMRGPGEPETDEKDPDWAEKIEEVES